MITVALVAFTYFWFIGMGESGKSQSSEMVSKMEKSGQQIELVTAYQCGNDICFELKASALNTIPIPVNGTSYYINDKPVKIAPWNAELGYKSCLVGEPSGLVLSLHFDEGFGNITEDDSGYGNDGILKDANTADGNTPPEWVDGKFGKALQFDGVDDYVEVADFDSTFRFYNNSFTITAWIYPYGPPVRYEWPDIVYKGGNRLECYFRDNDYDVRETMGTNIQVGPYNYNEWRFIALTYNPSSSPTHKLYIDSELKGSGTGTPYDDTGTPLYISQSFEPINGIIDEVRIYNRALSEEEIRNLNNLKLTPGESCYGKILNYTCKIGDTLKVVTPWGATKMRAISNCKF